jgi:hypothetical protein
VVEGLLRSGLVEITDFDIYLTNWMENGRNEAVVEFVLWIIQRFVVEHKLIEPVNMPNSLELLYRLVAQYQRSGLKPNKGYVGDGVRRERERERECVCVCGVCVGFC